MRRTLSDLWPSSKARITPHLDAQTSFDVGSHHDVRSSELSDVLGRDELGHSRTTVSLTRLREVTVLAEPPPLRAHRRSACGVLRLLGARHAPCSAGLRQPPTLWPFD